MSVDPPKFPPAYTTQMVIKEVNCRDEGCHTLYDVRARSVNATEGKLREDRIADDLETSFIRKSSGEGYDEVSAAGLNLSQVLVADYHTTPIATYEFGIAPFK